MGVDQEFMYLPPHILVLVGWPGPGPAEERTDGRVDRQRGARADRHWD